MKVNGIHVDYGKFGDGSKCVVLIHAIGLNRHMWDELVQVLRPNYCVVTYDLRGHGKTSADGDEWDLDLFAEDLKSLLPYVQQGSCTIVGHSLGGMIAQTFALRYPQLVDKLILSSTTSGQNESSRKALLERANQVEQFGLESIIQSTIERWFTPYFIHHSSDTVERVRKDVSDTSSQSFAKATRAIAKLDLWDKIAEIEVPTLVVTGQHDPGTSVPVAENIHQNIKDSQLQIIPNASHMTPFEQPNVFTSLIENFLNHS